MNKTPVDYLIMAVEVVLNRYGSGEDRKKAVGGCGYNYNKLQKIINAAYEKENEK